MKEIATISKLRQAQLAIAEVQNLDEIKRIIDQGEALKSYARAQKLSREIQDAVAEYSLYAMRQMGLLSSGLEKATVNPQTKEVRLPNGGIRKKDVLADAGIDIRRANEAEKLATVTEERFAEIIEDKKATGELTKAAVMEAVTKPHIANNSGNNEWYTPKKYIEAAKAVMDRITLDPASSDIANKVVKADIYYTAEQDGLAHPWNGKVWLNPPYSSTLLPRFIDKLIEHIRAGDINEAIVLVNNATETTWFSKLTDIATAIIFPKGRIRYYMPGRKTGVPLQGQAFIYYGSQAELFLEVFQKFGWGAYI